MSSTDDRIVRMIFDNAQFKKGAADTQKSLADLNKSVDDAGKGTGLMALDKGMGALTATASKMSVVMTTALATITNKAVNAGLKMAKSLAFDPIKQGFEEYESLLTKQNTIQNATGKSAKVVKAALNDLNTYSDKTIYSFGNMTGAIQKFVNAGVPLDESVESIKGIANAAAYAGASSEEASRAMYAFSQSMSLGFIGLQDWNQIENANMGTIQFKNTLLDAAVAAGTLTKKGKEFVTTSGKTISATKGWRDGLQEQWATTDVLNKALATYSDESTELGKKAAESAKEVRTFSAFMDTLKESIGSGWSAIFTALIGNLDQATSMWTGLSEAISGTVSSIFDFGAEALGTWRKMGGFEDTIKGFKNILAPIGALFKTVGKAWQEVFPTTGKGVGGTLAEISSGFEKLTRPLAWLAEQIPKLTPFFVSLFSVFKMGAGSLKDVGKFLGEIGSQIASFFQIDIPPLPNLGDILEGMMGGIKNLFDKGMEIGKQLVDGIISGFSNGSFDAAANVAAAGLLGAIYLAIKKVMKNGIPGLNNDVTGGVLDSITDSFGALTGSLQAMTTQIKAKALMEIAIAIGLLTASIMALSMLDPEDIANSMIGLVGGLSMLLGAMEILGKIGGAAGFVKIPLIAAGLVLLATSILILSGAIAIMAMIPSDKVSKALFGIAGGLAIIAGAMHIMPSNLIVTAAGLVLVAVALNGLATAMLMMSRLSWEGIAKGLAATAGSLVLIGLAMKLMPMSLPITAAGLVLVAVALNLIAGAMKLMATMSWDDIAHGLVAMGGALVVLALGLMLMGPKAILGAAALLVAAAAIDVLVPALLLLGTMSWEEIGAALVALAGGLVILAAGLTLMIAAAPGAAALKLVAPALLVLGAALLVLGQLSWEVIVKGLVTLAAALTVIGLAGLLLMPVIPALLGLGAAALMMGGALALAGAGVLAFATAITMLLGLGGAAFAQITKYIRSFIELLPELGEGFAKLIVSFTETIVEHAPTFIEAMTVMLEGFIEAGIKLLPKVGEFINKLVDVLLDVLGEAIPDIVEAAVNLIIALINGLTKQAPRMVEAAVALILALANGILQQANVLVTKGVEMIAKFLHDLASAIRGSSGAIGGGLADCVDAMRDVGVDMIQGMIGGFGSMLSSATTAIGSLAQSVVSKAKSVLKMKSPSRVFKDIGKFIVLGLTNGIQANAASAITAVASMVSGQIAVANEYVSKFIQKLDQQALTARGRAEGLAAAAERAAQTAERAHKRADKATKRAKKTKGKADDASAKRLEKQANLADRLAKQADKAADIQGGRAKKAEGKSAAQKAAQDKRKEFREADLLGKARLKSEDAQTQLDQAKNAERRAEAARAEAVALDKQAKAAGVNAQERKKLQREADALREQARRDARASNAKVKLARKSAASALQYQRKAGAAASADYAKRYKQEADIAKDEEAFNKLTDAEKAVRRREQAAEMQKQADADLARAQKLAYTDLEGANALAQKAMEEADQARRYLLDAAQFEQTAASAGAPAGGGVAGTVVDVEATEAASLAFNDYARLFSSGSAAAAADKSVQFNQYNTSPESLSPTEIYRRTNNLFTFAAEKLTSAA